MPNKLTVKFASVAVNFLERRISNKRKTTWAELAMTFHSSAHHYNSTAHMFIVHSDYSTCKILHKIKSRHICSEVHQYIFTNCINCHSQNQKLKSHLKIWHSSIMKQNIKQNTGKRNPNWHTFQMFIYITSISVNPISKDQFGQYSHKRMHTCKPDRLITALDHIETTMNHTHMYCNYIMIDLTAW